MSIVFSVTVFSQFNAYPTERRYDADIKIGDLKKKLELVTGAKHSSMKIVLSCENIDDVVLSDDEKTLGQYACEGAHNKTLMKMVVTDEEPNDLLSGDVPKYELSEEKYNEKRNNARAFIREMREKRESTE